MSPVEVDAGVSSRSKPIRKRKRPAGFFANHARFLGNNTGAPSAYRTDCLHLRPTPNRNPRHATLSFGAGCIVGPVPLHWAKLALSSFNKKRRARKEPEYDLVEVLQCMKFPGLLGIYHSNFAARLKNGREELFFAEVKRESKVCRGGAIRNYHTCTFCCILDHIPPHSIMEARPSGCRSCDRHPGCVKHPLNMDGFITEFPIRT